MVSPSERYPTSAAGDFRAGPIATIAAATPQTKPNSIRPLCSSNTIFRSVLFSNPNGREWERFHLTVRMSYDECRSWPVQKIIHNFPVSYSDLCIAKDGAICCLYEKGEKGGVSYYSGKVTFARFDLEWLTDGADSL